VAGWSDAEFDAFVGARMGSLVRFAYGLTGDLGHAEDLVQTALIKVYLRSRRIAPDDAERQPASVHPSRKVDEGAQTRPHAEPSASSLRSRVGHGLDGTRTSWVVQIVGDDPWPAFTADHADPGRPDGSGRRRVD
jgi:hypothetical protein